MDKFNKIYFENKQRLSKQDVVNKSNTLFYKLNVYINNVDIIGYEAFDSQIFENVYMDDSVKKLEKKSFSNTKKLKKIVLSKKLRQIEDEVFLKSSIKNIELPDSLEFIYNNSFALSNLDEIIIPKNVKYIGSNCFNGCINLKKATFLNNIDVLSYSLFDGCILLNEIELPQTLLSIQPYAFSNCISLSDIKFPKNLVEIHSYSFYNCYKLKELYFPSSVKSIYCGAFNDCVSLENLYFFGETVIDMKAFKGCYNLKNIYVVDDKLYNYFIKNKEILELENVNIIKLNKKICEFIEYNDFYFDFNYLYENLLKHKKIYYKQLLEKSKCKNEYHFEIIDKIKNKIY